MKGTRGLIVAVIAIWLAASFQAALSPRITIVGISPDFCLIVLACLSLFTNRVGGAVIGFFLGLVTGANVGANLSQYVVSRTISGFLAGWSRSFGLDANVLGSAVTCVVVTVVAQLIQMFLAPPAGITSFLGATIASALVNGVLAVPVFALLRRILGPPGA